MGKYTHINIYVHAIAMKREAMDLKEGFKKGTGEVL